MWDEIVSDKDLTLDQVGIGEWEDTNNQEDLNEQSQDLNTELSIESYEIGTFASIGLGIGGAGVIVSLTILGLISIIRKA